MYIRTGYEHGANVRISTYFWLNTKLTFWIRTVYVQIRTTWFTDGATAAASGIPDRTQSSLGSRGRCPGPITLLRLLGRSAVCTGSPVAGDCDGLGDTGPYAVRIPSSIPGGPSGRRAFKLGGHRACLQSVGPRAQSAARGPPWPGPGPALRGRCGVAAGASSAAAARLGRRGPGRGRAAGLGRG